MPIDGRLQERCERTEFDRRHLAFVHQVARDYPHVTLVDARHAGYEEPDFFDPHHLGRDGAAVYSRDLAAIVRTSLNDPHRPRWIRMPARGAGAPVDVPLEDIEQSRLALSRNRSTRNR
jgi:hypothetical protein